ncbi:hypothetical protein V8F20_011936 [Naviculisporaceae sp. PSN 640]
MTGQKLRERRGLPELRLQDPTPELALERPVREQNQLLRPSAMPRGFLSEGPTFVAGAGGKEPASSCAPAAAPGVNRPEVVVEEEREEPSMQTCLPGTTRSQNPALAPAANPITPVGQMIPSLAVAPATPQFVPAPRPPPAVTMAGMYWVPFTQRWQSAVLAVDPENAQIIIRACFYGGKAMKLLYLLRDLKMSLARDLRLMSETFSLVSVTGLSPAMEYVAQNQVDKITVKVSAEDSQTLLQFLLGDYTISQNPTQHRGRSLCSHACRIIACLLPLNLGTIGSETARDQERFKELDEVLGVFLDNFRKHLLPKIAAETHPNDRATVQLLARSINMCARWFLDNCQWALARDRAEKARNLIEDCAITPPPSWSPSEPRSVPDSDRDIKEYKQQYFRRERLISRRILTSVERRLLPTDDQLFQGLPHQEAFDLQTDVDDTVHEYRDDGIPAPKTWKALNKMEDPAGFF